MTPSDLRAIRKSLGLSQSALAERLRVDPRTVRRWECAEREIPPYLDLAVQHLSCARRS